MRTILHIMFVLNVIIFKESSVGCRLPHRYQYIPGCVELLQKTNEYRRKMIMPNAESVFKVNKMVKKFTRLQILQ